MLHYAVRAYNPEHHDAIINARTKGRVIVVPAGNFNYDIDSGDPPACPYYGAVLPEVICVGATNKDNNRCDTNDWGGSRGSNYGWMLDVMAPSKSRPTTNVLAIWGASYPQMNPPSGLYLDGAGTSSAFPQVAGVAAMLLTVNPNLSPAEVQAIIGWSAKHPSTTCDRNQYVGWGVLDATEAVKWALRKRFAVRNAGGKNIFSIDEEGNLAIDGRVKEDADSNDLTPSQDGNEFVYANADDTVFARLDRRWNTTPANPFEVTWPTLYLKGRLIKKQGYLDPPEPSMIVKGPMETVVAYFSSIDAPGIPQGSLVLHGDAFVGKNPDPDAHCTQLLFYDTFQNGQYSGGVTAWSHTEYPSGSPIWAPVVGQGDVSVWEYVNIGSTQSPSYILANTGTSTQTHTRDEIVIPQAHSDVDLNVQFRCVPATQQNPNTPMDVVFRKTSTQSIYVRANPADNTIAVYNSGNPYNPLATPLTITALPQQGPGMSAFSAGEWIEMHIYCEGAKVRVWIRERDTQQNGMGMLWWNAFPDLEAAATEPPDLALRVQLPSGSDGRWQFDNVVSTIRTSPQ